MSNVKGQATLFLLTIILYSKSKDLTPFSLFASLTIAVIKLSIFRFIYNFFNTCFQLFYLRKYFIKFFGSIRLFNGYPQHRVVAYQTFLCALPSLEKRGRGRFYNHKTLHIFSRTPFIFSKTSLSVILRTRNPILSKYLSRWLSLALPSSV